MSIEAHFHVPTWHEEHKAEFAPPSGSYQLPGAGIRSKYHRLDRDLRANAPKAQHVDTYTTQIPIDPHDHESAPW